MDRDEITLAPLLLAAAGVLTPKAVNRPANNAMIKNGFFILSKLLI